MKIARKYHLVENNLCLYLVKYIFEHDVISLYKYFLTTDYGWRKDCRNTITFNMMFAFYLFSIASVIFEVCNPLNTSAIEEWIASESPSEIVSMSQSSCYDQDRREHIVTVTILYRKEQTQQ